MKAVLFIFVWGPALLGYSMGWLIHHPVDWGGAAMIGAAGAILACLTYLWGIRRAKTLAGDIRLVFIGGMIAGGAVGVVIFAMLALRVIG